MKKEKIIKGQNLLACIARRERMLVRLEEELKADFNSTASFEIRLGRITGTSTLSEAKKLWRVMLKETKKELEQLEAELKAL